MELERLQVVIEASLGDFKRKMNSVKQIVNNATSQVKTETDKVKYSMDNMAGKVKTGSIDKLKDKIKSANNDLADMYARMDEMKASKYAELSEMPFSNEAQLDTTVENTLSKDKAYQKLSDSIRKAEIELERYKVTLSETNALQESGSSKSNKLAGIFDRVKSTLSKAKGQANLFAKNLKGINLAAIPMSRSIFKLSTMFKLLALRMIMRAAINSIKKGFEDLARYSDNFNGTMSQIGSVLLQARNSLATAFAPALQALTPIITSVTNAFINAFNTIGMFTARLFGNASTFTKAKQVSVDYAKSLGGVDRAAKKAGGTLASFDEINVLGQDSGSEDTGVPAASDMFEEITIPDESLSAIDKFKNKINELIEPLKKINFDNLTGAFSRLKEAISPFTNTIFLGLEWAYLNIFVPIAKWTITQVLPKFIDILSAALKGITGIIDALKPLGTWLWDNFLQPLAKWTGGKIVEVLGWLSEKLKDIVDWIKDNKPIIEDISIVIGSFAAAWLLVTGALKAWNAVVLIWNSIGVIATAVTGAFGAAVAFLTSPIGLVIIAIGAIIAIVVLLVKHWDEVKEAASKCWDWIKEKWNAAAEWFRTAVTEPLSKFFSGLWDGIKIKANEAWEGIKNAFKISINFMIGLAEGFVNKFIRGINSIISALNSLKFSAPDWVPVIGGKSFGINIPTIKEISIPRLATGAVIPPNSEFLAILGDQRSGKNIEAPEGLIRQIIKEELGGLNAGGQGVTINFAGNMAQLIRVLKPYIDKENSRVGTKLVIGGASS